MFYQSFWKMAEPLSKTNKLAFYEAITAYGLSGEEIAESVAVKSLMEGVKPLIDIATKRYTASIENGKTGGRPKVADSEDVEKLRMQGMTQKQISEALNISESTVKRNWNTQGVKTSKTCQNLNVNDNVNVNDNDNERVCEARAHAPAPAPEREEFIPPSLEKIIEYCSKRKSKVDPQRFFDHYESVDWYAGQRRMSDWKARLRTWEKQDAEIGASANRTPKAKANKFADYPQRVYDYAELERMALGQISRENEANKST